jgi:hypothetical protein
MGIPPDNPVAYAKKVLKNPTPSGNGLIFALLRFVGHMIECCLSLLPASDIASLLIYKKEKPSVRY